MPSRNAARWLVVHQNSELYGADRVLVEVVTALGADGPVTVVLPGAGPLVGELEARGAVVEIDPALFVLRKSALRPRALPDPSRAPADNRRSPPCVPVLFYTEGASAGESQGGLNYPRLSGAVARSRRRGASCGEARLIHRRCVPDQLAAPRDGSIEAMRPRAGTQPCGGPAVRHV